MSISVVTKKEQEASSPLSLQLHQNKTKYRYVLSVLRGVPYSRASLEGHERHIPFEACADRLRHTVLY